MSKRNKKKKNYRYKNNNKKTKLSDAALKKKEKEKEEEEWKAYDFLRSEKSKSEDYDDKSEKESNTFEDEEIQEEHDEPEVILMDDDADNETVVDRIDSEFDEDYKEDIEDDLIEKGNPIVKDFSNQEDSDEDFNIYKDFSIKTRDDDDDKKDDEEESDLSKVKKRTQLKQNKKIKKKKNSDEESSNEESKYKSGKKSAKKDRKEKKKKKKFRILKRIILTLFILGILAVIAAVAVVYAIFKTDKWAITREELLSEAGSIIYDKDGNELVRLTGDEINKKIELSEMSKVPDAFIAIEDERYYEHHGVDFKRTAAAIANFVIHRGNSSFGGSTITQQLVKITMKDDSRSGVSGVQRKIREWSRAYQVEDMLSKEEILTRYLNRIFLGSASNGLEIRGVEAAANYYFNKPAKDLSPAQAAFIAGINHAPNNYNPFTTEKHDEIMESIKKRTKITLDKMHELGKITDEEYNAAIEENKNGLGFSKGEVSNGSNKLSYHTAAAIDQIAKELADERDLSYSEARELLINSGYKIYTTVDTSLQSKMEDVFANQKYVSYGNTARGKTSSGKEERISQSGMALIEPSTGYVVAECGGLGKDNTTLGFNRGTAKRMVGSAFKPIATIAPGLENGYITASTLFYDVNGTSFGGYKVKNDDGGSHGICNMRFILTRSLNVPEVKLLSIMGTDMPAEFLGKVGIPVDPDVTGLTFALGSASASPVQMAAAYAMIVNKGIYITPTFYTKVVNNNDEEVISAKQESTRMMSEQNAYIEISLLKGPVQSGTASTFANYLGSMGVAGKTGTTDNYIDRWFCGFTPYYAAACWYGNDANNAAFYNGCNGGGNPAGQIWFSVMKKVDEDLEKKDFDKPEGIVSRTVCKDSGKIATDSCANKYSEIFNKDSLPGTCTGHSSCEVCKESGKLATEFCAEKERKVFGVKLETEENAKWSPKQEITSAPTEKCTIHVSAPEISVPNVVGKMQAQAEQELKKAGFEVDSSKKGQDKNKPKGAVLKQSATSAPKGSTIVITINTYSAPSDTPSTNSTPAPKNETSHSNTVSNTTKPSN